MIRTWTPQQENELRELTLQGKSNREIADLLSRTVTAVKSRRSRLGLCPDRRLAPAQIEVIKQLYSTTYIADIARQLDKSTAAVYQAARRLGLPRKTQHHPAATIEQVKQLHGQRLTDTEIGLRLNIDRRTINDIRRKLGLPVHQDRLLEKKRQAHAAQLKSMGISSRTELRTWAFRKYAREHGLPEDLPPRCVQIVYALAQHGPLTLVQICQVIGKRWRPGKKNNLMCNVKGSGGSYPAYLAKLGIIVQMSRKVPLGGQGHNVSLYDLTLPWREKVTQHVQNNQAHRADGSAA